MKVKSPKGRGLQMNNGAIAANGDVLIFLHSDTCLPNTASNAIRTALADNHVVGGAFDLTIQSDRQVYKIIAAAASLRSRITRIPYGDQAIFIKKNFFAVSAASKLSLLWKMSNWCGVLKKNDAK